MSCASACHLPISLCVDKLESVIENTGRAIVKDAHLDDVLSRYEHVRLTAGLQVGCHAVAQYLRKHIMRGLLDGGARGTQYSGNLIF